MIFSLRLEKALFHHLPALSAALRSPTGLIRRPLFFVLVSSLFGLLSDFLKLEDNCFTMLCWSLPYNSWNQSYTCISPLPPTPPLQLVTGCQAGLAVLYSSFPPAIYSHWCCVPLVHGGGPALEAIFIPCIGALAGPSDLETRVLQFWETHPCHCLTIFPCLFPLFWNSY